MEVPSYRALLRDELRSRAKANPSYSLRAFARDLRIDPSQLSGVMRGSHGLSLTRARRIAKSLGMPPDRADDFCDLVQMEDGRSPLLRSLARSRVEARSFEVRTLQDDVFRVVADWQHFAIRELCGLSTFRATPKWIARRLNIAELEARQSWARLVRLGLVVKDAAGRWISEGYVATTDGVPSASIRSFHSQVLEKARRSLAEDDIGTKSFSSVFFALHSSQVDEAKRKIVDFRRALKRELAEARSLQRLGAPDRLYCLNIQLFGLDRNEASRRSKEKS